MIAYLKKYWKALVGALVFCYILFKQSQTKDLEVENIEVKADATDAGLAQKQADLITQATQTASSAEQAEAKVKDKSATDVAKDLNSV